MFIRLPGQLLNLNNIHSILTYGDAQKVQVIFMYNECKYPIRVADIETANEIIDDIQAALEKGETVYDLRKQSKD